MTLLHSEFWSTKPRRRGGARGHRPTRDLWRARARVRVDKGKRVRLGECAVAKKDGGLLTRQRIRSQARRARKGSPGRSRCRIPSASLSQSAAGQHDHPMRWTRKGLTSKPASEIRSSISNLWLSAWFLMMATVRVDLDTGLFRRGVEGTSPGERAGEAGADIVG